MSSKNVKFRDRKDSPTSGSRTSSNGSHRRSDSGVGSSSSDYGSVGSGPDRPYAAVSEYEEPRYNTQAQTLQDALKNACRAREDWKIKAYELDNDLKAERQESNTLRHDLNAERQENNTLRQEISTVRKDQKETEARCSALDERNQLVESQLKKTLEEFARFKEEYARLKEENERLQKKCKRLSDSPTMSGAIPIADAPEKVNIKIRRSNSRSAKASEAEQDKARLSRRFERSDESDSRSDSTTKERRRRRESYVEPLGPPMPRPGAQVPPSPTRHYPTYTTAPAYQPQYTNIREPVVSSVPRSVHQSPPAVHPSVLVYDESPFHPDEDGSYFPHPLPRDKSRR